MNENFDNISDEELDLDETEESTSDEAEKTKNTSSLPADGRTEIVGIRFKKNGKTYYFAPNGFTLGQNDKVIVDTARGQEYGFTAVTNREIRNTEISEPLRSVIRLATPEDTKIHEENVKRECDAFNTCIALIDKHKLGMKLIDAELSFDRSKLLFYFSAEARVDFRELVKDLAGIFHTRIEMRQIGIRDEAKILGGLGICGRPYCCNTFLTDFGQVSVKMAKEQNLSLNSAKISGSCGRLMCCLRYEYDTYLKEKALTPKVDSRVVTPNGAGVVVAANPLAGIVKVRLDSQGEDADAIVFVREDVVDESKYDGQTLTKTEIPDRKRKNDELPSLSELTSPSARQAPASSERSEKSSSAETQQSKTPEAKADREAKQANSENGENQNKQFKNKHKKHRKGGANGGQQKNGESQNNENRSEKQGNTRREQPRQDNANRNVNKNPTNRDGAQPQNAQNQNASAESGNAQQKKKWKKPYYKHANKPKNRENGENK